MPWFFEEIKDKITIHPWVQIFKLHLLIQEIAPDFCINPLIPNEFNYSKSDLKLVESSAAGMACVGTVFTNGKPSPMDEAKITLNHGASVNEIDSKIKEYCNKDKFNSVIAHQYNWIETEGRYTESPNFINKLVKAIS